MLFDKPKDMIKPPEKVEKKKVEKKPEPKVVTFTIMHDQVLADGKNYQLSINPEDHRWYKAVELNRRKRDPMHNSGIVIEYGKPELLSEADIKFLDKN